MFAGILRSVPALHEKVQNTGSKLVGVTAVIMQLYIPTTHESVQDLASKMVSPAACRWHKAPACSVCWCVSVQLLGAFIVDFLH